MKICLINPPQILHRRFGKPFIFQPLGLLYIAAVLEKDYSVEIIDACLEGWRDLRKIEDKYYLGLTFDEIEKRIRKGKPDIVGISVPFSINEMAALKTTSVVKTVNKDIITVLGGMHPTVRPLETLSSKNVDFVIIGEGEITFRQLIDKLKTRSYGELKDVKGIGYKHSDNPFLTSPRELIQDLDSVPSPARHLLSMDSYFEAMKENKDSRYAYIFNTRYASIITSRGCPYQCNFCSIHLTMGNRFRARSPKGVIEEIKKLKQDYNIKHINFEDDNLTLNKKRFEHILDLTIENRLDITWSVPNGIRPEYVDENLVRKMKASGCKRVFVAPESGEQKVVTDIVKKNLDLKKIEKVINLFKRYGIIVDGSFVIGMIGETKKDIWNTVRYALRLKKLGLDKIGIHIATPYYGTQLYEQAKNSGYLRKDLDSSLMTTTEPLISTSEWSREEIHQIQILAIWLFNYNLRQKIYSILGKLPSIGKYIEYIWRVIGCLFRK